MDVKNDMTIAISGGKRMLVVTPDIENVKFKKSTKRLPVNRKNKPDPKTESGFPSHARLQGRREIFSQVSSSICSAYSLIENSLPHAVQQNSTLRQPTRSSTSFLQILHFIKNLVMQESGASSQESEDV